MHTTQLVIPVLAVACFAGCSKSPTTPSQVATPISPAETAALMTNSLDVLQARYQENEKQIEASETRLDALRQRYGITDTSPTQLGQTNQNGEVVVTSQQPYWDEKRKLTGMIEFQKALGAKIEAEKLEQQFKPKADSH
jgi:hypothetical protein